MRKILAAGLVLASVTLHAQQSPLQRAQQLEAEAHALVLALTPPPLLTVGPSLTLQAAANAATPGATICVPDGTFVTGTITLPVVAGASSTNPVTLRSCTPTPGDGLIVAVPSRASSSPVTIQPNPTDSVTLHFAKGAGFWNVIGLRFTAANASATIIGVGDGTETALSDLPHDIILDRIVVDGAWAAKRGVALNGINVLLINSTVTGIMKAAQDTQCVSGWNGPGPFTILNNYLSGGTEGVMFGGADPVIAGLIPGNITFTGNYVTRPKTLQATKSTTKNDFELKNAHDVTVTGNVFENAWIDEQAGWAVQITVRNQSGHCPWCTVQRVEFAYNVVRHAWQGVNVLGLDDIIPTGGTAVNPSVRAQSLNFHDNLFYDLGAAVYGSGSKAAFTVNNGPIGLTIAHNTVMGALTAALTLTPGASKVVSASLIVRNNILPEGSYGITDSDGSATLGAPSWLAVVDAASVFDFNQIQQGTSGRKIVYPGTHGTVGTVTFDANDVASPAMVGSDGQPVGANLAQIKARIPLLDLSA